MSDPKTGIEVKSRKKRFKIFDNCFLARDAVIWITKNYSVTHEEAIQFGRKLVAEKKMAPVFPPASIFDFSENFFSFVNSEEFSALLSIKSLFFQKKKRNILKKQFFNYF